MNIVDPIPLEWRQSTQPLLTCIGNLISFQPCHKIKCDKLRNPLVYHPALLHHIGMLLSFYPIYCTRTFGSVWLYHKGTWNNHPEGHRSSTLRESHCQGVIWSCNPLSYFPTTNSRSLLYETSRLFSNGKFIKNKLKYCIYIWFLFLQRLMLLWVCFASITYMADPETAIE